MDQKIDVIAELFHVLEPLGIALHLCCEPAVLKALPPNISVYGAECIPNQRLTKLFGPGISPAKDSGQRISAGCNCGLSRDIGSYSLHACRHNCLYCYANPAADH